MTWQWIITLQWQTERGQAYATNSGTLPADAAAGLGSRNAIYLALLAEGKRVNDIPAGTPATTLFFALESDALPAGSDQ